MLLKKQYVVLCSTCLFCPILWALAWACRSFWGFQSESNMTTVSAEAKLMPRPPARVDNRKQKSYRGGKKRQTDRQNTKTDVHVQSENTTLTHTVQKSREFTSDPSALKWSNACFLISPLMEPSNLCKTTHFSAWCTKHFHRLWIVVGTQTSDKSTLVTWNKNWRLFR